MMSVYGLTYRDVLDLPLTVFWILHGNVDRIRAETDLRLVSALAHSHSGEGITRFTEQMRKEMGTIVDFDEAQRAMETAVYDREGLLALKTMNGVR